MAIYSSIGTELQPEVAVFDREGTGPTIGAIVYRPFDRARRFYMLRQMIADGGEAEIMDALAGLPHAQDDSPEFQEALEK